MRLFTHVHDIKTLVLSFHPLIVIETVEEERVSGLLQNVTSDLEMPLSVSRREEIEKFRQTARERFVSVR